MAGKPGRSGGFRPGAGRKRADGTAPQPRADGSPLIRKDGWANVLSSARTSRDPRTSTRFAPNRVLQRAELDDLYRDSGLARKIVDALPNIVTRDPWRCTGDTDNDLWTYLEGRQANWHLRRLCRWARLYGGAVMVMGIADGGSFESPLNLGRCRTLDFLRVYDRFQVASDQTDWQANPRDKRFGMREFYTIQPLAMAGGATAPTFRAHWTRVVELDGLDVSDQARLANQGWGDSVLQLVYEEIERWGETLDNSSAIVRDFVQGVLTIKNLSNLLRTADGEQLVKQRLEILDLTRHVLNTMLLDDGETYTKQISSVSGVSDILDRIMASVAAVSDTPQTILFGRSPAGENATGEGDARAWYDSAAAYQRETLGRIHQRLAEVAIACEDGPDLEQPVDLVYAKLWQPTEKEEAERRKLVADTDAIYIDRQVLMPEEVALARFGGDSYNPETELIAERDPEEIELPDPDQAAPGEPGGAAPQGGQGEGDDAAAAGDGEGREDEDAEPFYRTLLRTFQGDE